MAAKRATDAIQPHIFSGIFHKISIFKVLSYTDAQEVNLYEYKPGMLMN